MFISVVVWRFIYVLWCGCGEVNIIIIILFLDLLDMCIVFSWVCIFIYLLCGIGCVFSLDIVM